MRKFNLHKVNTLCILLVVLCTCTPSKKGERFSEVENRDQSQKEAPKECLDVFREFFTYIKNPEPDIVTDESAKQRWFSKLFRVDFENHLKKFNNPQEEPDYPSNSTFIGVWNFPTTLRFNNEVQLWAK